MGSVVAKTPKKVSGNTHLPLIVERDEDGFYVVECPLLDGCYTQGRSLDEALKNIRGVIAMIATEAPARRMLKAYRPRELSLHTITL